VHGARVVSLRRHETFPPEAPDWSVGDIAASDHPGVAVSVRVADCVPILLADARTGTVAAVHAGWRGTASGAARSAVEALGEHFGTAPSDLVAAIGPSIGPCCYRVGQNVRAAFEAAGAWAGAFDAWFSQVPTVQALRGVPGSDPAPSGRGPALFLDTWTANADQLRNAGVPVSQIHLSRVCTSCHRDTFLPGGRGESGKDDRDHQAPQPVVSGWRGARGEGRQKRNPESTWQVAPKECGLSPRQLATTQPGLGC
jgi:YfiH family protein